MAFSFFSSEKKISLALDQRQLMVEKTQFTVAPRFNKQTLSIHIRIDSTQNPALLDLNLVEHCIIQINGALTEPLQWVQTKKSDHILEGTLQVPVTDLTTVQTLELGLFLTEAHTFSWAVKGD